MSEFAQRLRGSSGSIDALIVSVEPLIAATGDTLTIYATRLRSGDTFKLGGVTMLITDAKYGLPDGAGLPYLRCTLPAHADGLVSVELVSYHSPKAGNDTASFTYESPVVSNSLVFACAWPTVGNLTDSGGSLPDWDAASGNQTNRGVATALSRGVSTHCPSTNVAFVGHDGVDSGAGVNTLRGFQWSKDLGRTPQAGDELFVRKYVYVRWSDAHGDSAINPTSFPNNVEHGCETKDAPAGTGGGVGANLFILPRSNGTFDLGFRDITVGRRWYLKDSGLLKNAWYRILYHLTFAVDRYTIDIGVWDHTNSRLFTSHDFVPNTSSGGATQRMDADYVPVDMTNLAIRGRYRCIREGTNGPSSNWPLANCSGVVDNMWELAALAASFTNDPGVYIPGEAP